MLSHEMTVNKKKNIKTDTRYDTNMINFQASPDRVAIHGNAEPLPPIPDSKSEWLCLLDTAICAAEHLGELDVPPRLPILGEWFRQGDLGFIYGPRGLGKTWLAMHIARQCADGGAVGPWKAHQPRRVLYIDGEMPLDDIRQRDGILTE